MSETELNALREYGEIIYSHHFQGLYCNSCEDILVSSKTIEIKSNCHANLITKARKDATPAFSHCHVFLIDPWNKLVLNDLAVSVPVLPILNRASVFGRISSSATKALARTTETLTARNHDRSGESAP